MVSALFGGLAYLGWACLLAVESERWVVRSYLGGNLIFMALAWPAVRAWGTLGASVASCVGLAFTLLVMTLRLAPNWNGYQQATSTDSGSEVSERPRPQQQKRVRLRGRHSDRATD
jgi:hypothetical protein